MKRILWFRRDLRVEDNPILSLSGEVLPMFIFDSQILNSLVPDDKRVSFIFDGVVKLKHSLRSKGLDLKIYWGDPVEIFAVLESQGFDEVVASGDYDAYAKERDIRVSHILHFRYLHDTYIFNPAEILKDDGTPYLVFTPFYNKAKALFSKEHLHEYTFGEHTLYLTSYEGITKMNDNKEEILPLDMGSIGFTENLPKIDEVETKLKALKKNLPIYTQQRDFLDKEATSHLSIDLRFGTISIRSLLRFLVEQKKEGVDTEPFFRQLIFRDFYAYLLFHFPTLATHNYKYRFNGIEDEEKYRAFCEARTGVPIVDAGIRELLQTGLMHNRVRMICASFFTKDLLLPWQWGEKFFAKYLLDYDAASNILSWQWSAGTGIDPQPYFRIFNPYLQSKKFDKEAGYIKKWIPELRSIDAKKLHDENYLLNYTIEAYPKPIVVHKEASQNALAYFKQRL
ncbi:deoxyribodipyrimidine photo-lyase [Sulfurovum sp. TSL1]|uniref:cryptochrome/photolyase family protein n=1 Tax=Sulfurovum sp. TSL1 TaxID=2826994 RepID=UPI001CC6C731|nr:deoxyribodipyrimidine photo-lyase [Sulfurovum sp. TSL1]GIT97477.1 deoxyribodipyrimidine photo-lyase [Sulfurovum sp. TSL1]